MIEMGLGLVVYVAIFCVVLGLIRRANGWFYDYKMGEKRYELPPGDMGWPFIGNMWSFLIAFKSNNPDSFVSSFIHRFGRSGIYKVFMFGNPSVIVTTPETCKRVLTDDDTFTPGWPVSTVMLMGEKSFIGISYEEHKRLRRLTATPINGNEALTIYMHYIEDFVKSALDKWSKLGKIEFLTEVRKLTFRIVMYIFLSSESEAVLEALETEYTTLNYGVRAMAINIPGFAYYSALKAEQEVIAKNRPPSEKGMTLKEYRQMDYLSKVIDETLRLITFSLTVFREAKKDVKINGYLIPKGWKALVWFRTVHHDPEVYPEPMEFNPSRWDDFTPKAGAFIPFGAGSRLCPGNDLAKLEISVFLHHFLLNYELERDNPECPLMFLPHCRPKDNCLGKIRRVPSGI